MFLSDSKAGAKTEDLIRRLSVKDEIDYGLLDSLKQSLKGNISDKKNGVTAFFENYRRMPHEADELIVDLAKPSESVEITRLVAQYFADEKIRLSAKLELKLLEVLSKSEDDAVKKLIEKKRGKYAEYFENLKKMIEKSIYFSNKYNEQIEKTIQSAITQSSELLFKIQQKINYSLVSDVLNQFNKVQQAVNKRYFLSYYPPEVISAITVPSAVPKTTIEEQLINELINCPKGKEGWKEYQDICGKVIEYLFVPPLGDPTPQDRTDSGVHVRDYILQIPYDLKGFWNVCQFKYNSVGVVFEIKNRIRLEPNDIVVSSKYLDSKRIGNFGIILARDEVSTEVKHEIARIWRENDKLIVVITDNQIMNMIKMKSVGDEPEKLIEKAIFDFRRSLD